MLMIYLWILQPHLQSIGCHDAYLTVPTGHHHDAQQIPRDAVQRLAPVQLFSDHVQNMLLDCNLLVSVPEIGRNVNFTTIPQKCSKHLACVLRLFCIPLRFLSFVVIVSLTMLVMFS